MDGAFHIPVLLSASVDGLNIGGGGGGGVFVDATLGGGGHTREILRRLCAAGGGHLYSFDHDAAAVACAPVSPLLTVVHSNFRYLANWLRYYNVAAVDGILADLGVSSHHLDTASRGFSLRVDCPLDMRMNPSASRCAADILAEDSEEQLADIFYHYGDLRQARRIAHAIVLRRAVAPLRSSFDLLRVVSPLFPREREKKESSKLFQALRIAVNDEVGALATLLDSASSLLRSGGRLVVLTYHSLEDRMVKNVMKTGNSAGRVCADLYGLCPSPLVPVLRHAVTPSPAEVAANPRARSAKLRIAEKR